MKLHATQSLRSTSVALALAAASWGACTEAGPGFSTTSSSAGGQGGDGGQTTGTTTSSDTGTATSTDSTTATTTTTTTSTTTSTVCTPTSVPAAPIPLDMVVLADRSGSMSGEKWDTLSAGLKALFQDAQSAGMGAGLVFFPNDQPDDCVWTDYASLDVPVAPLPGNALSLVASIDATLPNGPTPTWGALKAALYAATTLQDANPMHKVVVVLATDGDPTSCAITDATTIADLAASARHYNGVQTYALGLQGATLANLHLIAAAGGTGQAIDITQNVGQFSGAMADIRFRATACELVLPPPPAGQSFDAAKVNVEITPAGSSTPMLVPHAPTAGTCSTSEAWYYDDNSSPKKIMMCPAACANLQANPGSTVAVAFGCPTL